MELRFSGSTTLSCTGNPTSAAAEVPITAGPVWRFGKLPAANSANIDTLFFYVAVASAANTPNNLPGLGQSSVTGSFAPFYAANSTANAASSSLPIPRFIDNATPRDRIPFNQCVTNLLFPFVTNQAGFDTGIAISNTSRDPFIGQRRSSPGGYLHDQLLRRNTPVARLRAAQTTNAAWTAGAQVASSSAAVVVSESQVRLASRATSLPSAGSSMLTASRSSPMVLSVRLALLKVIWLSSWTLASAHVRVRRAKFWLTNLNVVQPKKEAGQPASFFFLYPLPVWLPDYHLFGDTLKGPRVLSPH